MRRAVLLLLLAFPGCEAFLEPDGPVFDRDMSIGFEDVTAEAGLVTRGSSWGIGWGDVNADGLPDIWSTNHADAPQLYVNRGDGTFHLADGWLPDDLLYDAHAVLWVDLDGDGDQDIVESVGAQQGTGIGANRVYRSLGDRLEEVGQSLNLHYPLGSGRCPIPMDWNEDGRIDILFNNALRADEHGPTGLFTQSEDGTFDRTAVVPPEEEHPSALCGQLVDLDDDDVLEVVRFGRPSSLSAYDLRAGDLVDVGGELGAPPASRPWDVVFADLDNDADMDAYVARWEESSEVVPDADGFGLRAYFRLFSNGESLKVTTEGDVTVRLDPQWFWSPADIRVGAECRNVTSLTPTFPASDQALEGLCPYTPGEDRGLFVGRVDGAWVFEFSTGVYDRGNLTITSSEPITAIDSELDTLSDEDADAFNRDRLFIKREAGWAEDGPARGIDVPTQCTSIAAGDLDNDMDVDLYLACATPVQNLPNVLLRNDSGVFTRVDVPGSAGTTEGRADAVALADFDEDGFLDLLISNGHAGPPFNDGPLQLLRHVGNANHWLELDLVGTRSNRDAIGSTVYVTVGDITQVREVRGGTHAMAQHYKRVHFGLAWWTEVEEVRVVWPDGTETVLEDVAVDRILEIRQE